MRIMKMITKEKQSCSFEDSMTEIINFFMPTNTERRGKIGWHFVTHSI